jgi:regulator of protease activity HflC (stomatin/prohibitin superfamily)
MASEARDTHGSHGDSADAGGAPVEKFDPANQSLSDALRKSFSVLKVLMLVLVVLYFLSGLFSVKLGERGVILRFGKIVGAVGGSSQSAVLKPSWYWSWPFPIDEWRTVPVNERQIELSFMLGLTPKEKSTDKIGMKFGPLAPERDDYIVTGDKNILHVTNLIINYQITNVADYVTNVYPMPDSTAKLGEEEYLTYPEYTVLRNLARNAVIETAAHHAALEIRGDGQAEFLLAVGHCLARKLDALDRRGASLGISIEPTNAVLAPKSETGDLEGITPPLQTKEDFDKVYSAQSKKSGRITEAKGQAESLLVNTAGPQYEAMAEAVDAELVLLRKVAMAEAADSSDSGELSALREALASQRDKTERLLLASTGRVRSIIGGAKNKRDRIIKDAAGDYDEFIAQLPEYLRNPRIYLSRRRDEARARAIGDEGIVKVLVPPGAEYRLHIPQSGKAAAKEKPPEGKETTGFKSRFERPEIKMR